MNKREWLDQACQAMIADGWIITNEAHWVWRNGRQGPKCSPLGARLLVDNRDAKGNWNFPLKNMSIDLDSDYVAWFYRGLIGEKLGPNWSRDGYPDGYEDGAYFKEKYNLK